LAATGGQERQLGESHRGGEKPGRLRGGRSPLPNHRECHRHQGDVGGETGVERVTGDAKAADDKLPDPGRGETQEHGDERSQHALFHLGVRYHGGRRSMGSFNTLHDRLLSHRLRGFSPFEGSLAGLRAALDQGVKWIEIDTRVALDGTVLVFHDSHLDRLTMESGPVAGYSVSRKGPPRYRGTQEVCVPTLEVFLRDFAAQRGAAQLMLDIKDAGSEEEHCRCIAAEGLDNSVWVIAWSPQILRRVHEIAPQLRLGLSHVPLTRWRPVVRPAIRALGRGSALRAAGRLLARRGVNYNLQDVVLYLDEVDGVADPLERARGSFPVHFASHLLTGEVGEILRRTGGGVGAPAWFLTPDYVERAHREGLSVFVYCLDSLAAARKAKDTCDVDIIFTNNPRLFSQAQGET